MPVVAKSAIPWRISSIPASTSPCSAIAQPRIAVAIDSQNGIRWSRPSATAASAAARGPHAAFPRWHSMIASQVRE